MSEDLDSVDVRILDLLQRDASLSIAEIAEKVGLSSSPAWRRIERLKKTGVIVRQVTLLDQEKLGLTFEVFATVKLQLPSRENLDKFETAIAGWPEVVECATVTGAVDYMLRVVTRDIHAYDDFLRDKMLASMSSRAADTVRDEIEERGPMRLAEVLEAQKQVLVIARKLADAGTIQLAGRGGEDYV